MPEPITVNIGGIERELRFTLGSLVRLSKKRIPIFSLQDAASMAGSLADVVVEGISDVDGKAPQDFKVSDLMGMPAYKIAPIMKAVNDALNRDLKDPEVPENPPPAPTQ